MMQEAFFILGGFFLETRETHDLQRGGGAAARPQPAPNSVREMAEARARDQQYEYKAVGPLPFRIGLLDRLPLARDRMPPPRPSPAPPAA